MASATPGADTLFASPMALQDVQITNPVGSRDQVRSRQCKQPVTELLVVIPLHGQGIGDHAIVYPHKTEMGAIDWIRLIADSSEFNLEMRKQFTRHKIEVHGGAKPVFDGMQQQSAQLESEVTTIKFDQVSSRPAAL